MDIQTALKAFAALSQETRLKVFKILIEHGKSGVPAGFISEKLSIPHNTLSFHLSHLSNAGLIRSERQSRQIIYSANLEAMQQLIGFLVENCCVAETESCGISKKTTDAIC